MSQHPQILFVIYLKIYDFSSSTMINLYIFLFETSYNKIFTSCSCKITFFLSIKLEYKINRLELLYLFFFYSKLLLTQISFRQFICSNRVRYEIIVFTRHSFAEISLHTLQNSSFVIIGYDCNQFISNDFNAYGEYSFNFGQEVLVD